MHVIKVQWISFRDEKSNRKTKKRKRATHTHNKNKKIKNKNRLWFLTTKRDSGFREVTACRTLFSLIKGLLMAPSAGLAWRRQACLRKGFLPEARWWWWCWWCAGETVLILGRCWDRPQIRIQLYVRKIEKSSRCWTFLRDFQTNLHNIKKKKKWTHCIRVSCTSLTCL